MIRSVAICLLAVSLHSTVHAASPEAVASTRRIFEVSKPELLQTLPIDLDQAKARNPQAPPEIWPVVTRELQLEFAKLLYAPGGPLERGMARLADRFSEPELRKVLEFFESDLGKRWVVESQSAFATLLTREEFAKMIFTFMGTEQEILKKHGLRP